MSTNNCEIRVMHVVSGDLWAGAESQVYELTSALARFHHVSIAAAILNEGELAQRLRSIAEVRVMPESSLNSLQIFTQLVQFVRQWQPTVVHTHRTKENVIGSLAAWLTAIPGCVRTVHGAPEHHVAKHDITRQLSRLFDRAVGRHMQSPIVTVSDDLATALSAQFPKQPIRVIRNGIDVSALRNKWPEQPVRQSADEFHLAVVGRVEPVKRVDLAIGALRLLLSRRLRYRLHIVGHGTQIAMMKDLANALNVSPNCTFHGFQSPCTQLLASMDCLLLPSDHEGLPMVALEARALGLPVVASAVGGLPRLLENDDDCVLLTNRTPVTIADAVEFLSRRFRSPRTPLLSHDYHSSHMASEYLAAYQEAICA